MLCGCFSFVMQLVKTNHCGKFIGRYREAYFKVASMNPSSGVVFQYKPKEGAEELIYQRISDITISMKALDYLNMPDCIPTRYEVEMNAEERKLYDTTHHSERSL